MPDNDQSSSPRQRATVVIGDYELGPQIGRGSFATVYRGINKRTNTLVAIKSVVRSSLTRRLLENLETEINILRTVKHPMVVELIDCLKSRNHIHLVMEYCSLGDLAGYLRKRKDAPAIHGTHGGLRLEIVRSFVRQLGAAMLFLRSRDVIHRDIKTQNILLQPPAGYVLGESEARGEFPHVKIADFGFARNLPSTALAETLCGSPLYMAPEILHYEPYDAKADLWSIGAVVYEMVAGKPPFTASNHVELARVIERTADRIVFPDEGVEPIDPVLKDLVRGLLKMSPKDRMPFEDFFVHPAIQPLDGDSQGGQPPRYPPADKRSSPRLHDPAPRRDAIHSHAVPRSPGDDARPSEHAREPASAVGRDSQLHSSIHTQDSADQVLAEREYVVIEKRAVEMNVLADELESSPRAVFYPPRPGATQQAARQMTALARAVHAAVNIDNSPLAVDRRVFNPLDTMLVETFESAQATVPEDPTVRRMEALAYKAFAMSHLADLKWRQLNNTVEPSFLDPASISLEEAFALYLRALSLLHQAMAEASRYWRGLLHKQAPNKEDQQPTVSGAFNNAVQWVRGKFNECLERAEVLKSRGVDVVPVVEVLYEQALALSKAAAVRELKWVDPLDCDRAYQLAIWMLSAILEPNSPDELVPEDRAIVEQFIASIVKRRETLQRRLVQQDPV
ncbi:Serine/threonine-protein kinase [Coemansia spiralis]|uniref:non-specific serine/threonine protein kinase n=2 Tax=Coemansia TaxID=4863 RepID=A0A9W8L010_9FUNG|nr:kinase-like domain-containing protein [Coemansia spiralis]KAJ1990715.1 Serine/threonine-protein kinase [Coemansia umbellata]KAJ2621603.1 Serine/threonine-protein kinase [Coemansia sp. RSA 1358]KAJ2680149.1 Serine/threonine-protein kinase [Coemansia spiralis]